MVKKRWMLRPVAHCCGGSSIARVTPAEKEKIDVKNTFKRILSIKVR
jgi:hypothetical protein